jgi:hypothetical protein
MTNVISLQAEFERQKNLKASLMTLGIAGLLVLMAILIKWPLPSLPQPQTEEFIEVNLGSGDEGFGSDQPKLPGQPAQAQKTAYTPPQPVHAVADNAKDVETDDRETNDAPAITKPVVSKPNASRINENNKVVKTTQSNPQPVVVNTPPRPKAVLGRTTGGNGNGGNGADSYQPGGNEGIAGGNGDQGRPGGNPNSGNYSGAPKNFGVRVLNIPGQSFEDDFNENAKVAMDIVTDGSGKVITATYQPRGSTSNSRKLIDIARRRAFELKNIGSGDGPQKGTVIFNFKVRS